MSNAIFDKYQNAYLPHRSTETALTLIINDIIIYLDNKAPCYLVLLYLYSAFDNFNIILFPLDLMKLVYMVNSTVGLCILFHLEHIPSSSDYGLIQPMFNYLLISLISSLITPFP